MVENDNNKRKRVRRIKTILFFGPMIVAILSIVASGLLLVWNMKLSEKVSMLSMMVDGLKSDVNIHEREIGNLVNSEDEAAVILKELSENDEDIQSSMDSIKESITEEPMATVASDITDEKVAYITIDDGPSDNTAQILDILKEYDVHATFFVVGNESEEMLPLYKRMFDEGHTIGIHSYSHEYGNIYSSAEAFRADVLKIRNVIKRETGYNPWLYRFPGGSGNARIKKLDDLVDVLDELDMRYCDWNQYAGDAVNPPLSSDKILSNSLNGVDKQESVILLMHDTANKDTTVQALPDIIAGLRARGFVLRPIEKDTELIHNQSNTLTH